MNMKQLAIWFGLAVALAACATDLSDDGDTSTTEQDLSSNQRAAFHFFVSKGLTKRQSAGIVGNLIQESSVVPTAVEYGGGPGRGIAQWSVGGRWDHSYHDNNVWYAHAHGQSRWSLSEQLNFIWYELHSVGGYGLSSLRRTTTIRGATLVFMRDFEICGTCDSTNRVAYARQVYNAYAGTGREIDIDDEITDAELPVDVVDEEPGVE